MTNEEKAKEIAEKNSCDYPFEGGWTITSRLECEDSGLEMAEWKDQQFKEYLEKKKNHYMRHRELWQQDTFEWCCCNSQIDTIDGIINELFGGK